MKLKRKFQQGGPIDPNMDPGMDPNAQMGGEPGMEGGMEPGMEPGGPEEQLMMMAQEIIGQIGPEGAAMLAEAIMGMLQGGGAPQEAPTFARRGGKLVKIG